MLEECDQQCFDLLWLSIQKRRVDPASRSRHRLWHRKLWTWRSGFLVRRWLCCPGRLQRGNYVRVAQGDGNTVTYIHLLNRSVGTNTEVGVGTKIGEMNCTGYCGGGPESPNHGKISSTHVHIQVKRTDDSTAYLDAVDLYGGESCAAADVPPGPPPPEEPCNPIPELRNNDQANRQVQHCLISGGSQ